MTDWLPIETAPRNGIPIEIKATLINGDTHIYEQCRWLPEAEVTMLCCEECGETYEYTRTEGWFDEAVRLPIFCTPTHWRANPKTKEIKHLYDQLDS